jgi:hypothetical protein
MTSALPNRLLLGATIAVAIILVALTARRSSFGVDVTDESFYVALPYEFVLGNKPFADEKTLQQTAGILLTPFVRARVTLKGGTDGLVLFMRRLYLLLACAATVSSFLALRCFVRAAAAAVASLLPVAFIPFSIPNLSYNTMGALLLTIGLMAGAASLRTKHVRLPAALHVIALGLAAVAYPTLIVAVCAALIITTTIHLRGGEGRGFLGAAVVSGVVLVGCFAVYAIRTIKLHDVLTSFDYVRSFGVHVAGWAKLRRLLEQWGTDQPYRGLLGWEIAALVAIATFSSRRIRGVAVCGLLLLLPLAPSERLTSSHFIVILAALVFLPPIVAALHGSQDGRILLLTCSLPSLVAGIITSFTSSNGLGNAAIGLLPAAIVAVALAVECAAEAELVPLAVCASLALPAALQVSAWNHVYRDDAIALLTQRIDSGPFAGIFTAPAKARFLAGIRSDVLAAAGRAKTCAFYDDFPAGYLFSAMRPVAPSVWLPPRRGYPLFDRRRHVRFFSIHPPDAVFEMRSLPVSATEIESLDDYADPLHNSFWREGYRIVAEREAYTVYDRCPSCSASPVDLDDLAPVAPGASYAAAAAKGWTWYEANADGGRAAITTSTGAILSGAIPEFKPGDYEVDLSFYGYGPERQNKVSLTVGKRVRELAFGQGCQAGIFRIAGIEFRNLTTADFAIRALEIGQQALILDTAVFRRVSGPGTISSRLRCVSVGEESEEPRMIEAESMSGIQQLPSAGWAAYEQPFYSGQRAVLTARPGAELRQTLPDLVPGDYEVTLMVYNYGTAGTNEVEVGIGNLRQRLRFGGPVRAGEVMPVRCIFKGLAPGVLTLKAVSIGQQTLIVDSVALRRIR